jgi:hypothetical protein
MTNQGEYGQKKAARNGAVEKLKFEFRDPNSESRSKEISRKFFDFCSGFESRLLSSVF